MFAYWFFIFIPLLLAFSPFRAAPDLRGLTYFVVAFLYIGFIGFRREIGADWENYLYLFEGSKGAEVSDILLAKDIGYYALNWLVSNAGGTIYIVNMFCAAIFTTGLLVHCKNAPNSWLTLLVATPYLVFVVSMGLTRQGVAIGLGLLAIHALQRRSLRRYLIFIILSTLFHKTAIILLPLGLMAFQEKKGKGKVYYLFLASFLLAFPAAMFYEQYLSLLSQYVVKGSESSGAYFRAGLNLIASIIILAKGNEIQSTPREGVVWKYIAFGAIFCALATPFASTASDRLGLYFSPVQLYAIPRLIKIFKNKWLRIICKIGISVYAISIMVVWLEYSQYASAWVPYKSSFF